MWSFLAYLFPWQPSLSFSSLSVAGKLEYPFKKGTYLQCVTAESTKDKSSLDLIYTTKWNRSATSLNDTPTIHCTGPLPLLLCQTAITRHTVVFRALLLFLIPVPVCVCLFCLPSGFRLLTFCCALLASPLAHFLHLLLPLIKVNCLTFFVGVFE